MAISFCIDFTMLIVKSMVNKNTVNFFPIMLAKKIKETKLKYFYFSLLTLIDLVKINIVYSKLVNFCYYVIISLFFKIYQFSFLAFHLS